MTTQLIPAKRDTEFYCYTHLIDLPLKEQSRKDPRYCHSCYGFLRKQVKMLPPTRKPSWRPKKPTDKKTTNRSKASPTSKIPVSKIEDKGIIPIINKKVIMKHRGRPPKMGGISRITNWRRQKAADRRQGVLI